MPGYLDAWSYWWNQLQVLLIQSWGFGKKHLPSVKPTACKHLKMDAWNTFRSVSFWFFFWPIFKRGGVLAVGFREWQPSSNLFPIFCFCPFFVPSTLTIDRWRLVPLRAMPSFRRPSPPCRPWWVSNNEKWGAGHGFDAQQIPNEFGLKAEDLYKYLRWMIERGSLKQYLLPLCFNELLT